MKHILLVTYDFPPVGGSGVQRVAKFARYLPDHGWEPIVLTTRGGRPIPRDHSLLAELRGVEVCRVPALNPYRALLTLGSWLSVRRHDPYTYAGDLAGDRRGPWHPTAFLIPDGKLPWISTGLAWAIRRPRASRPDLVLSSLPTPTAVVLGSLIARLWGVPHVIDYRDPWTDGYYLPRRPALLKKLESAWEQRVLAGARAAVYVPGVRERLPPTRTPLFELHNGYDESDFQAVEPHRPDGDFVVAHTGLLFQGRDLEPLIEALRLLRTSRDLDGIHFVQVGRHDRYVQRQLESLSRLVRVSTHHTLPHRDAIAYMLGADLLYLPVSHDHVPGKAYEYLRSGRPILVVGPEPSHLRTLLAETGCGRVFEHTDIGELAAYLDSVRQGRKSQAREPEAVAAYSRSELTARLARVLDAALARAAGVKPHG